MSRKWPGVRKGRYVALTPLMTSDLPTLFQWINDRSHVLLNAPYRPISDRQHAAWFEDMQQRRDSVIFGVRLVKDWRLVGSCQLHSVEPVHRTAELQIRVGEPKDRGRGFGTEAIQLLLDFGFDDLNLNRISLQVWSSNEAALRAYEKSGFQREGILRQAAHVEGGYVDIVVMGILRQDARGR